MSLELARRLIAAARDSGSRRALKPLSIIVLDAGGQVRAFEREDGASNARFEIAFGKANGALALGMGSRAVMARAEQQPYFIGAVGVTGDTSNNDEAAPVDAIEAVGLAAVTG